MIKFIGFFLLMLAIILSTNFYVFYRFWHIIPAGSIARPLLMVFAVMIICSFFLGLLGGSFLPSAVTSFVYRIGTSWFFICLYFLMIFLLIDLLRLTNLVNLNKFLFGNWITFGVLTGVVAIIMTWGYFRYINKERVELTITVDKNMETKKPLKIVAISDLHLGFSIGKKEFEQWVELINKENPDIVLIVGDIIDNYLKPVLEQDLASSFRKIKSKYGVYAAIGNHEYIRGNILETLDFLHDSKVTVLRDSAVLINDEFYIVGRDDRINPNRKTIKELTNSLDHSKPIILLDHQPFNLEEVEKNNIDLQISGHTHQGQIWPISWITNLIYEKSHGYLKKGNSHIYVSSGIGIWGGKFRIGTQSEYVVIYLN
jgi:hypothetical protein